MRTLLTGFGPFGLVVNNPSARVVEHFARVGAPDHELTVRVLPVSYARAAAEIHALLGPGQFDAALLLGVAQNEPGFRIEQVARRRAGRLRPDRDGLTPLADAEHQELPDCLSCDGGLDPLLTAMSEAGLPVRLSDDAGGYVCNHTYYAALAAIREAGLRTRCLFLHLPPDETTLADVTEHPTLPLDRQIEGVALTLAWLRARGGDERALGERQA